MIHLDFIIIYEHKARELENVCLLAYELKKRGYSVEIVRCNYYSNNKRCLYKADVAIIPACYNNFSIKYFTHKLVKYNKIVNLQWEQVLSIQQENESPLRQTTDVVKNVVHVSWGQHNRDRLVNRCCVNQDLVEVTGHITLDFLRNNIRSYYLNRNDLFQKFCIPKDKVVCLFISSFSYVGLTKTGLDDLKSKAGEFIDEFYNVSVLSQRVIIEWIESILMKNKDIVFVYRPHPSEVNNINLKNIEKNYNNFRIIRDLSVKQWILASDKIYTWYSTSIVEAFYAGKMCNILRPYPIRKEIDCIIYNNAQFITTYDKFESSLDVNNLDFPIPKDDIHAFYQVDETVPSYIKIANLLERVKYDNKYKIPAKLIRECDNYPKQPFIRRVKIKTYEIIDGTFLMELYKIVFKKNKNINNEWSEDMKWTKEVEYNDYASKEEIDTIIRRIQNVMGD